MNKRGNQLACKRTHEKREEEDSERKERNEGGQRAYTLCKLNNAGANDIS